jgi:3-oxoacyl-[acyl-carrier protein] reductase
MAYTFQNRVALVTGAGRGIGKAIAQMLASHGVHVICVSKSETNCKSVADEINAAGHKASHMAVDVSKGSEVKAACEALIAKHETIDILVNNAGITKDMLVLRLSDEDWDSVIQTNLSSAFYWTKHLLRPMTSKRWGRIINISSVVGLIGNPGQANYAAAKAGMLGLTKAVAREVASRSITVNAVCPGFVNSDMTHVLNEKIKEAATQLIPLKRFGEAADIANMVTYLASEEGGYITGQAFTVDGGMAM